jgi:hypothetical protein
MAWHRRPQPSNWRTIKASVLIAHNGVCHVWTRQADQCDHIINVARGGSHDVDNLAPIQRHTIRCQPLPDLRTPLSRTQVQGRGSTRQHTPRITWQETSRATPRPDLTQTHVATSTTYKSQRWMVINNHHQCRHDLALGTPTPGHPTPRHPHTLGPPT